MSVRPGERGTDSCACTLDRRKSASISTTSASAFSESAPAILIAVTLLPSPAPALDTAIVRGCRASCRILVRTVRYCSDARQFAVSKGRSGECPVTFNETVRASALLGLAGFGLTSLTAEDGKP